MKDKRKGSVTNHVNGFFAYAAEYAPELRPVVATMFPFRDVIGCFRTGPHETKKRKPYFGIEVIYGDGKMLDAEITADGITVMDLMLFDDEWTVADKGTMTLDQLHEFLRQLPRPAHGFYTSSIGDD